MCPSPTFFCPYPYFKPVKPPVWLSQRLWSSPFIKAPMAKPGLGLVRAQSFSNSSTTVFPIKKILSEIIDEINITHSSLEHTCLVYHQHHLETTAQMLEVLKEKLKLKTIIGTGKSYSDHLPTIETIRQLGAHVIKGSAQLQLGAYTQYSLATIGEGWLKAKETLRKEPHQLLIALDEGGDLLATMPAEMFTDPHKPKTVIGIEQTKSGTLASTFQGHPFPVIDFSGSFLKTQIEYPYIAEKVAEKASLALQDMRERFSRKPMVAIMGYGGVGKAVVKKLSNEGYALIVHDKDPQQTGEKLTKVQYYPNAAIAISNADVIIGCTGQDLTACPITLSAITHSQKELILLINVASKDTEFNKLLQLIQAERKRSGCVPNVLETFEWKNKVGKPVALLRGLTPFTFDNQAHCLLPEHIWPTRAGLLACQLMALQLHETQHELLGLPSSPVLMLDPTYQLVILRKYYALNPLEKNPFKDLTTEASIEYIKRRSSGIYIPLHIQPKMSAKPMRQGLSFFNRPIKQSIDEQVSSSACIKSDLIFQ